MSGGKMKEKEALEGMVWQFGYRTVHDGKPNINTGGLSALEDAFEVLGWEDPHYLPEEGCTCEVVGCMEPDICGTHWGELYLRLCSKHHRQSYTDIPGDRSQLSPIKQYALDRETTRCKEHRILPPCPLCKEVK